MTYFEIMFSLGLISIGVQSLLNSKRLDRVEQFNLGHIVSSQENLEMELGQLELKHERLAVG